MMQSGRNSVHLFHGDGISARGLEPLLQGNCVMRGGYVLNNSRHAHEGGDQFFNSGHADAPAPIASAGPYTRDLRTSRHRM